MMRHNRPDLKGIFEILHDYELVYRNLLDCFFFLFTRESNSNTFFSSTF